MKSNAKCENFTKFLDSILKCNQMKIITIFESEICCTNVVLIN